MATTVTGHLTSYFTVVTKSFQTPLGVAGIEYKPLIRPAKPSPPHIICVENSTGGKFINKNVSSRFTYDP